MKHFTVHLSLVFLMFSLQIKAQEDYASAEKSPTKNFYIRFQQEQGVIINLTEKEKTKDYKQNTTANFTFGISAQLEYKKYFAMLGYNWQSYTVSVSVKDEPTQTSHKFGSTSENFAYSRIPLKLGMQFETPYSWLKFSPFMESNFLYSKTSGISFTSSTYGSSVSASDSLQESLQVSLARPYKNAWAAGAGFMLTASRKWLSLTLISEYFQSNKDWTEIRSYYNRNSQHQGHLTHIDYYNSKAKSIVVSLALCFRI